MGVDGLGWNGGRRQGIYYLGIYDLGIYYLGRFFFSEVTGPVDEKTVAVLRRAVLVWDTFSVSVPLVVCLRCCDWLPNWKSD